MRVLGVDPGLTRCGLGVVESRPAGRAALVAMGVVRTPADGGMDTRLLAVFGAVESWIISYHPDAVAVERVFSQHNVSTVMGTAQAGAVAVLAAARHGLPVALHTPTEVKAAVTGSGRAGKAQVTSMVTRLLRLPNRPTPADVGDALALALCHLWRGASPAAPSGPVSRTAAQRAWADAAGRTSRPSARSSPAGAARPGVERPVGEVRFLGGRAGAPARRRGPVGTSR